MPTLTETTLGTPRQVIYDWLREQARHLGIDASLLTHQATVSDSRLYLPVYVDNAADAYDAVTKIQELEDGWNYQNPEPSLPIFLVPTDDKPVWLEAYMPVQNAKDRQQEAFEAYLRTNRGSEEEKEALKELEAAKLEELEAAKQLDRAV